MESRMRLVALGLTLLLVSCSDEGLDVPADKLIGELSDREESELCRWYIEQRGGAGEHSCPGDITVTIVTQEECEKNYAESSASDDCTVSLWVACIESLDSDLCSDSGPPTPECRQWYSCLSCDGLLC